MHWVYYFGRGLIRLLVCPFATWRVIGEENIPGPGPYVIVCNHIYTGDPPIVAASLKLKCVLMAKEELFRGWWSRFWVANFGAFPVNRGKLDTQTIRQAEAWIKKGFSLIIFPEGSRSPDGTMQKGLTGAAFIAGRMGVPILPVAITGSEKFKKIRQCFPRRVKLLVTIGRPFPAPSFNGKVSKEERERLTDEIMGKIAGLLPPMYRGVYGEAHAEN